MESLYEFQKHHKNKANLAFHVLCGVAYTCMVFHAIGPLFIPPYVLYLCFMFPKYSVLHILIGIVLYVVQQVMFLHLNMSIYTKLAFIAFFYMAPELSHWATHEKTVLNVNDLSLKTVVENFLLLLPMSILSFINEP